MTSGGFARIASKTSQSPSASSSSPSLPPWSGRATSAGSAAGTEDEYELTSMKGAVDTFNATFWDALDKECKEELAVKARDAAGAPTVEW